MATVSAEEQVGQAVEPALGDIDPAMLDPSKEVPQLAPLMALEEVYRELDTSYRDLQSQVSRLRSELAVTHSARLEELSEKERLFARLSSLLAVLPGGVIILDGDQRVRDANPAAIELLGEPLIGELWVDVVTRNPELDGQGSRVRRLSVSSRPLEQYGEQVVLITDTTEVHELQEQLNRRHRLAAMGEMAASLAHQIRTPLASTTLYLSQLASAEMAHEQRERVVDKLGDRLSHMEGLIESMLSFVRGRSPESHLISLRDVLAQLDAAVRPSLEPATHLTITPVDDTLKLVGAVDDLVGALSNLVRNAAEVSGGDVHIDIWAGALSRDWLQIRVQDTGPGIPEDILPRLFDPFFTTRAQGTGLGLAVVAMTAANHGGEVRAQNRPGGGAVFYIDLPIAGNSRSSSSSLRSSL
ncbi:MAG: ATP-binding protein [Pseudomonadota bacterium]